MLKSLVVKLTPRDLIDHKYITVLNNASQEFSISQVWDKQQHESVFFVNREMASHSTVIQPLIFIYP